MSRELLRELELVVYAFAADGRRGGPMYGILDEHDGSRVELTAHQAALVAGALLADFEPRPASDGPRKLAELYLIAARCTAELVFLGNRAGDLDERTQLNLAMILARVAEQLEATR